MNVQSAIPLTTVEQLQPFLAQHLPQYKVERRFKFVVVGQGSATGVLVRPTMPNGSTSLAWAFPSTGVQMLLTLSIVLTGILPGLLLFLIVWLAVKGNVEKMKGEIAAVLRGGGAQAGWGPPAQGHQALPGQMPAAQLPAQAGPGWGQGAPQGYGPPSAPPGVPPGYGPAPAPTGAPQGYGPPPAPHPGHGVAPGQGAPAPQPGWGQGPGGPPGQGWGSNNNQGGGWG